MATEEEVRKLWRKYPIDPDKELLLWEEWITIRRDEANHLAKRLQEPPVDLAMNLLEKVCEDKTRKTVLEHAQIHEKAKLRGHPWEQPTRLLQQCYCRNVYEVVRTAAELGEPRIIEHIGVPHYVLVTDKGLTGEPKRTKCPKLSRGYLNYREKRENELKSDIERINPYTPDIAELVVIGKKPELPPPPPPDIPEIIITEPDEPEGYALCGVYALKINKTIFCKDIPNQKATHIIGMQKENGQENCTSWIYYFNVLLGKAARSKLCLQNLGTVTLRYCWKRIKRPIPYIPEDSVDQVFFFNKNEDVISPGQKKYLCFTFVANRPGIYKEFWELSLCNINFFDIAGSKLIINLHADAFEHFQKNTMYIDLLLAKISHRAVYKVIHSWLEDILKDATIVIPPTLPYKKLFLEAEMFVLKNPVCFYHQTDVENLKKQFIEMCGSKWDLSISTWRKVMIDKEYDERMMRYDFLKSTHRTLLRPWYEGEDLLKEKYRTVRIVLGQLMDSFYDVSIRLEDYNILNDNTTPKYKPAVPASSKQLDTYSTVNPFKQVIIKNLFYMYMYEQVAIAIDSCAGILSSLDLNRWIEFDFCQI